MRNRKTILWRWWHFRLCELLCAHGIHDTNLVGVICVAQKQGRNWRINFPYQDGEAGEHHFAVSEDGLGCACSVIHRGKSALH